MKNIRTIVFLSAAASVMATAGFAQTAQKSQAQTAPVADDGLTLETVVVTGTQRSTPLLRTAAAISDVGSDQIEQQAPLAVTDLLQNVPGVHIETSGGESNANLSVRGLPIASGGAKYVHFDEDGLPVLEFGDIAFGNADGFIKSDYTVKKVEVIRGGTAATFESNAPGGVVNFISKTGEQQGGQVGLTKGLDYDTTRLDFNYGSGELGNGLRFNVGGYYHTGEGPLHAGFTAENGGQIKANITKEFDRGFLRLSLKVLDDRTPTYLPTPFAISGSATNPTYSGIAGFDPLHGSFLTPYLATNSGIGPDGQHYVHQVSDGYHAVVHQVGAEFSYDIGAHTHLDDKLKVSQVGGDFVSPYTAGVDTAANVAASTVINGLTGRSFTFANGPSAGQAYAGPVAQVVMFDTQLKSLDNFSNKLELTHVVDTGNGGAVTLAAGYYKSRQIIDMDWDWNSYFLQVSGRNAALLNLTSTTGAAITSNGLYAYGAEFWGQCCQRNYNLSYDTDAPYLSVNWEQGGLDVTGALRYDIGKASGTYNGATVTAYDVNGDGAIQRPEMRVPLVNPLTASIVNYSTHYLSWSLDANYAIDSSFALFAGASRGGRTNADRLAFGDINADGSLLGGQQIAVNMVTQYEAGVKYAGDNYRILLTPFYADTQESNYDVTQTSDPWKNQTYHAYGVELESGYHIGNLDLTAGLTWTHSRIVKDKLGSNTNHIPQRQADWLYQIGAVYNWDPIAVGVNLNGTSSSYTSDANNLVQPGYTLVNGFVQYNFDNGFSLQLNARNIFNSVAITEVDSGATAFPGYVTARAMPGRTMSINLKYQF